uniref:Uncharacterized protein n=1 Tax=viral metagenome TaxID=1070528 RepID=A0A6M3XKH5_9ZZZZ
MSQKVRIVDTDETNVTGEVTASPTSNTILARLKDLLTGTILATSTNAIGKVGHDITGIGDGVTVVTTAGTDVALASSTPAKLVIIQAQTDNVNKIAVGATGVDAVVATGTGIILDPGDTITLPCDNLADIFIDALASGEGCRYTYFT